MDEATLKAAGKLAKDHQSTDSGEPEILGYRLIFGTFAIIFETPEQATEFHTKFLDHDTEEQAMEFMAKYCEENKLKVETVAADTVATMTEDLQKKKLNSD